MKLLAILIVLSQPWLLLFPSIRHSIFGDRRDKPDAPK